MAKAFTIARALAQAHTDYIVGKLNGDRTIISGTPGRKPDAKEMYSSYIDPATLTFNTGFVDGHGAEIFIGDYVNSNDYCLTAEVVFDDEYGAFFIKQDSYSEKTETEETGSNCDATFTRFVISKIKTWTTELIHWISAWRNNAWSNRKYESIVADDGNFYFVDSDTVKFSTTFEDIHGDEIFIGDFLAFPRGIKMEVVFDVDQGAFFCVQEPIVETDNYEDKIVINRKTIMHRLTRHWAAKMEIVDNSFEGAGNE